MVTTYFQLWFWLKLEMMEKIIAQQSWKGQKCSHCVRIHSFWNYNGSKAYFFHIFTSYWPRERERESTQRYWIFFLFHIPLSSIEKITAYNTQKWKFALFVWNLWKSLSSELSWQASCCSAKKKRFLIKFIGFTLSFTLLNDHFFSISNKKSVQINHAWESREILQF